VFNRNPFRKNQKPLFLPGPDQLHRPNLQNQTRPDPLGSPLHVTAAWARAPLWSTSRLAFSLRTPCDRESPPIPLLAVPDGAEIPVTASPHRVSPVARKLPQRCMHALGPSRRLVCHCCHHLLPGTSCSPTRLAHSVAACRVHCLGTEMFTRACVGYLHSCHLARLLRRVAATAPYHGYLPAWTPAQGQESLPGQLPLHSVAALYALMPIYSYCCCQESG
jgi:hypothetical protein